MQQRPREVVLAGTPGEASFEALARSVRGSWRPQRVVALARNDGDRALLPVTADKPAGPHRARAYVCEAFRCLAPADTPELLREQLRA
jgi:uncharacterized protein YyaL (SSP411 family)